MIFSGTIDNDLSDVANWKEDDGETPASSLPDASTHVSCAADVYEGTCVCASFNGNGLNWLGGTITAPNNQVSGFAAILGSAGDCICTNRYDNSSAVTAIASGSFPHGITLDDSIVYGELDVALVERKARGSLLLFQ